MVQKPTKEKLLVTLIEISDHAMEAREEIEDGEWAEAKDSVQRLQQEAAQLQVYLDELLGKSDD